MVDTVAGEVARRPRPAAGPFVVAVEGRSGSGKTELATACAARLPATLVHMDDLYPGWDGLAAAVDLLAALLVRLRTGAPVSHPVWDWGAGTYARQVALPDRGVVLVEGVGSGCAGDVDLLVWVQADAGVRRERALRRDGETFRPHWERWAAQEEELFTGRGVRERADLELVADASGGAESVDGPRWELRGGR